MVSLARISSMKFFDFFQIASVIDIAARKQECGVLLYLAGACVRVCACYTLALTGDMIGHNLNGNTEAAFQVVTLAVSAE